MPTPFQFKLSSAATLAAALCAGNAASAQCTPNVTEAIARVSPNGTPPADYTQLATSLTSLLANAPGWTAPGVLAEYPLNFSSDWSRAAECLTSIPDNYADDKGDIEHLRTYLTTTYGEVIPVNERIINEAFTTDRAAMETAGFQFDDSSVSAAGYIFPSVRGRNDSVAAIHYMITHPDWHPPQAQHADSDAGRIPRTDAAVPLTDDPDAGEGGVGNSGGNGGGTETGGTSFPIIPFIIFGITALGTFSLGVKYGRHTKPLPLTLDPKLEPYADSLLKTLLPRVETALLRRKPAVGAAPAHVDAMQATRELVTVMIGELSVIAKDQKNADATKALIDPSDVRKGLFAEAPTHQLALTGAGVQALLQVVASPTTVLPEAFAGTKILAQEVLDVMYPKKTPSLPDRAALADALERILKPAPGDIMVAMQDAQDLIQDIIDGRFPHYDPNATFTVAALHDLFYKMDDALKAARPRWAEYLKKLEDNKRGSGGGGHSGGSGGSGGGSGGGGHSGGSGGPGSTHVYGPKDTVALAYASFLAPFLTPDTFPPSNSVIKTPDDLANAIADFVISEGFTINSTIPPADLTDWMEKLNKSITDRADERKAAIRKVQGAILKSRSTRIGGSVGGTGP